MNKILFKLIEGKGKFFLMRDVKVPALRMDELDANCHPELGMQLQYEWDLYHKAEDEALKNGEIVNPEVLPGAWINTNTKDGDTFDLPEGMGFVKDICWNDGTGICCCHLHSDGTKYSCRATGMIHLLPEKIVQKEELQEIKQRREKKKGSGVRAYIEVYNFIKQDVEQGIHRNETLTIFEIGWNVRRKRQKL